MVRLTGTSLDHDACAVRLNLVAVWREATVFTEAERAALELGDYQPGQTLL
jgi:hypothetical protein